ncbi:FAD-dependent monooxygenase [Dictyobacter aurantiacus]|uniref:Oxygenase n=1 Tax=Dictyobacter aurantiacus TaxID=1936993 RepID=A0A401ZT77_9CHLR|nr:FAD-dependent monooxygenase [Dictyobacter aurantiacus]GCE10071.1 oxygenase [Dictyobacter aurantiacus]
MTDVSQTRAAHDVLIVGAGPVGLTLANDLLRRGISCRLIDSAPRAAQKTKALGIHAKTLELFAKMGVAHTAIERGLKSPAFRLSSDGKRIARIDFQEHLLESPYPYVLMLPQHETEQLLTAHLHSQHGAIEWRAELIGVTQDEQGADAVVRHADGKVEQIRVGFVVGCDGAHSTVRHLLGLHFAGTTFEQSFAVGNVRLAWALPYDEIVACVHRGSFIAYFPMADGRHRVVIAYELEKVPPGEVTLEEIQRVIETCGPVGARASEPADLTRFHVNQRRAEHYRCGRIFLAGDAAHIHSPIGAQGMNTGIQDALNLSWKLALTIKGLAAPRLLESYEVEREQVGEALLRGTERATRLALTRNPLLLGLRTALAPLFFSSLPGTAHRLAEALSEISIAYPQSPIVVDSRDKKGTLLAGDRAPNALIRVGGSAESCPLFEIFKSPRSILLVLAARQEAEAVERHWREVEALLSTDYQEMIELYLVTQSAVSGVQQEGKHILYDVTGELHRRYEAEQGGVVLIRPDGYIGFWGQAGVTEALRSYVQSLFCPQRERRPS